MPFFKGRHCGQSVSSHGLSVNAQGGEGKGPELHVMRESRERGSGITLAAP